MTLARAAATLVLAATFAALLALAAAPARAAGITAFQLAAAQAVQSDRALADWYRARNYAPVWTGDGADHGDRRAAFLHAVAAAPRHGLPAGRYDADALRVLMASARTAADLGRVDVALSERFVAFAGDLQSGILRPQDVDPEIKRDVVRRDPGRLIDDFIAASPAAFLRSLAPTAPEYLRLVAEKARLEAALAANAWGAPVATGRLEPGQRGSGVVALRDRLVGMGYLRRTASAVYDAPLHRAVEASQADHGLPVDGVAGPATLDAINVAPSVRLGQILVAMERERWLPRDLGRRHVRVNLTDYHAEIVDRGAVVFRTRSVIGKDEAGRRTPEFSDVMEFMVVNPSWYVPRSIVVNEYLPQLQRNPGALGHMRITDSSGREVSRARGFGGYTARSFPFAMRQPPSPRNALGLVKFMFPNPHNIYLHDTPAKDLFGMDARAFSHGCIRLGDPFDFAYALLAGQEADPEGHFQRVLGSGAETRITLQDPVPVHLVYRTAIARREGGMQYRPDVYGRDARILAALRDAGVPLPGDPS